MKPIKVSPERQASISDRTEGKNSFWFRYCLHGTNFYPLNNITLAFLLNRFCGGYNHNDHEIERDNLPKIVWPVQRKGHMHLTLTLPLCISTGGKAGRPTAYTYLKFLFSIIPVNH
jgi:hypothetical protein